MADAVVNTLNSPRIFTCNSSQMPQTCHKIRHFYHKRTAEISLKYFLL